MKKNLCLILPLLFLGAACFASDSGSQPGTQFEEVELSQARFLATLKLREELLPPSKNYLVRQFSFLGEKVCDFAGPCEVFGIANAISSDGEYPEVSAKSICCFTSIGKTRVTHRPRSIYGRHVVVTVTTAQTHEGSVDVEMRAGYFGKALSIQYRVTRK